MNAMGSDYIREVNVVKSARVGYGCIQDADAQREGINASARYPKNWVTTGDPAREFTMIQSAPLMLLADPDAFVSVQLA
ncbi:phage major capsid E family protein [Escherichia coli 5-172-05_S3_C1]|nr:phage major capsid E family protein [Escherichia coli 5-172-05_S3_C1]